MRSRQRSLSMTVPNSWGASCCGAKAYTSSRTGALPSGSDHVIASVDTRTVVRKLSGKEIGFSACTTKRSPWVKRVGNAPIRGSGARSNGSPPLETKKPNTDWSGSSKFSGEKNRPTFSSSKASSGKPRSAAVIITSRIPPGPAATNICSSLSEPGNGGGPERNTWVSLSTMPALRAASVQLVRVRVSTRTTMRSSRTAAEVARSVSALKAGRGSP